MTEIYKRYIKKSVEEDLETLLKFGGFPEPFFKAEKRFWRKWQRERVQRGTLWKNRRSSSAFSH